MTPRRFLLSCLFFAILSGKTPVQNGDAVAQDTAAALLQGTGVCAPLEAKISDGATEEHTYYVALTGKDSHSGSEAHPWRTIKRGIQSLEPGDTLCVKAGRYEEAPIVITQSGTGKEPIIIRAHGGDRVVIAYPPQGPEKKEGHYPPVIELSGVEYVHIDGFHVVGIRNKMVYEGGGYSENGISITSGKGKGIRITNNIVYNHAHCGIKEMGHGGSHFLIEGNVTYNNGIAMPDHGIYIPSSNAIVQDNVVHNNAGFGIHLYESPENCIVTNNVVYSNAWSGIIVSGANNVVVNNVCYRNGYAGFMFFRDGCRNNVVKNNVFYNNDGWQIFVDNAGGGTPWPSDNAVDYNCIYPETDWIAPSSQAGNYDAGHSVFKDPKFIGAGKNDFRIRSDSPCIDAGSNVGLPYLGLAPDIGAFEFGSYPVVKVVISAQAETDNVVLSVSRYDPSITAVDLYYSEGLMQGWTLAEDGFALSSAVAEWIDDGAQTGTRPQDVSRRFYRLECPSSGKNVYHYRGVGRSVGR